MNNTRVTHSSFFSIESLRRDYSFNFDDEHMITKHDILEYVDEVISKLENDTDTLNAGAILSMFKEFRRQIVINNIFDAPKNSFWFYEVQEDYDGIFLSLVETDMIVVEEITNDENGEPIKTEIIDVRQGDDTLNVIDVITIEPRLFTVDEFAKFHDVNCETVESWINECKIRAARKINNKWYIPENAIIMGDSYIYASYNIREEISNLPKGFEFIKGRSYIHIKENPSNTKEFIVSYHNPSDPTLDQEVICNKHKCQELEFFLIESPNAGCAEYLTYVDSFKF